MKTLKSILVCCMIIAVNLTAYSQEFKANDIIGKWEKNNGNVIIKIFKKGGKYYGKTVWLKTPNDDNGKPKTDLENPNPKLQKQNLMGMVIMRDFVFEDGEWEDGELYDPKTGKTYSSYITMESQNIMNMRGYIGISIMGKTMQWTRVKE